MKEISLHILDIVQNSIQAGAKQVIISITEDIPENMMRIEITDNGKGMNSEILAKVNDPFFTSGNKKTGLGLPLLKQHAEAAGGAIIIESGEGKGTTVIATFVHDHPDRQPIGDITTTMMSLIRSNPEMDFIYSHSANRKKFVLDTRHIKQELEGIPIGSKEVIVFLRDMITGNLNELIT